MKRLLSFLWTILLVVSLVSGCAPAASMPAATLTPAQPTTIPTTPASTPTPAPTSIPRTVLPVRGLYVTFERRGSWIGYFSGQVISHFNEFDSAVGHTIAEEVSLQLDAIKQMGVNTIAFELETSDAAYFDPHLIPQPPNCPASPDLGLLYPQPPQQDIANLVSFLDLLQSKGLKVYLRLENRHMEEQPPTNNEFWLGTILKAIKDHPALDLVLFEGDSFMVDSNGDGIKDTCGGAYEPALWEGANSTAAHYVQWAIEYAHSLGLPYRKLSAEAIVGNYYTYALPPSGPEPNDPHPYDPINILKGIFDNLNIPNDQRTYAISFYEHWKCSTAGNLPCVDENPHAWAVKTVTNLFDTIGRQNGARVVAIEMGLFGGPVEKTWPIELTLESLIWIMQAYGIDGGCFWHWTDYSIYDQEIPAVTIPIKRRGAAFDYYPVKDVMEELYTRGQADDLKPIPESIPPAFGPIVVTPPTVQSGKPFEITANLGETHIFVTADVSALDPGQTDLIPLTQVSDGVYRATVTLNPWNPLPNGARSVRIEAMDFWSNISTTTVEVELQNPSPVLDVIPPDDDFTGKDLDTAKWTPGTAGGATVTQDERLILSTDSKEAFSSAGVSSNWNFPGDFDLQVDFEIGKGWGSPVSDHLDGAFLAVTIAGQNYRITRLRSGSEDKFFAWSSTGALIGNSNSDAVAGKYRLVRSGTTLFLLFDAGKGWQQLASTAVPADPAQVNIGNGSINASQAFTTYFDNFHINSGLTTYKP